MTLNVCRAHPDSLVEAALAGLIRIFAPSAQKAETPFVEVRNGEHSTHVRQDVLRQTQEALIKEQLLPAGSADGAYGPRTRQALSAYQTKQGLPATGIPDPATLVKILVPKG